MSLIYQNSFFASYQSSDGSGHCIIDLKEIFRCPQERSRFELKWQSFWPSDSANEHILFCSSDTLYYSTKSVIPPHNSSKPPLLLLFGNPAPHSVKAGVMFLSEGVQREHRIWRFLSEAQILSFDTHDSTEVPTPVERIKRLYSADYHSPFRIGMASFLSFPSTASDPAWSGVAGVKRLFGSKAFTMLCCAEAERLQILLKKFMPRRGIVVAFQKDAYDSLRSANTPAYSLLSCLSGALVGTIKENPGIFLGAVPPTRLIMSTQAKKAFVQIVKEGHDSIRSASAVINEKLENDSA
jgi:hypothetical protein